MTFENYCSKMIMAKNRARIYRLQPPSDVSHWNDREDSGVQLDEPSSPQSKHFDEDLNDIVSQLTNPNSPPPSGQSKSAVGRTVSSDSSKSAVGRTVSSDSSKSAVGRTVSSDSSKSAVGRTVSSDSAKSKGRMGTLSKGHSEDSYHSHNSIGSPNRQSIGSPKRQSKSNHCDKAEDSAQNSQDMNVEFTVTLSLDEDEGLEIKDMTTELPGGDNFIRTRRELEEEENSSTDDSTEISDIKEVDNVDGVDDVDGRDSSVKKTDKHSEKKEKDSKKRRFRKMIGRPLRRSQSAGCETDLQVPEHALFLGEKLDHDRKDESSGAPKRMIHKTTSADAAMMANEVLPIDPSDLGLVRSKPKSSLAKNMKRKLQALRRRNTDSSLGVTIMKLHGTGLKISHADTQEWAKSFDSLLMDKTGLELFRNFLKSEFSEENIDFWIACEEFKTTRTNKLAHKAEQIYTDFVAIKAPKQVNLDSKTRLDTVTNLDNPTRDMYKSAQKRIQYLMEKDPYPRFLQSEIYLQLARQSSRCDSR